MFILSLFLFLAACTSNDSPQETEIATSEQNNQNSTSFSAEDLRTASLQGNLNVVQEAVEQGVEVDEADQLGRTALMFASFNGHTEVVQFLAGQGAGINRKNTEDRTALMFAASGPFPETVEFLLKEGADPNVKDNVEGWTPLMYAAAEGNREVVEILLGYGADASLEDTDAETAIDFARNNGHQATAGLLE